MAAKPLRLLHAANLRLDSPLQHVVSLRDEVRDVVESATLVAFERLVSVAVEKDVDALLITGNTFDSVHPGLAAEVALRQGFERLEERQIPVVITPGESDPASAWFDLPALPKNVHLIADLDDAPIELTDRGRLLVTLIPVSADSSFETHELDNILATRSSSSSSRSFVVGMLLPQRSGSRVSGTARVSALDWLVCGQGSGGENLPFTDGVVHVQSGPQGLSFDEPGSRGATLLEVDSHRKTKQTPVHLAPVRWDRLIQKMDGIGHRDHLLERMVNAVIALPDYVGEQLRFIDWRLERSSGSTFGWESTAAVAELAESLTKITDQADGLRYVHRIRPVDPDLSMIDSGHREVLTEFLLALGKRTPVERLAVTRWLNEAHLTETFKPVQTEAWAEDMDYSGIADRATQFGWEWFAGMAKK